MYESLILRGEEWENKAEAILKDLMAPHFLKLMKNNELVIPEIVWTSK